MRPIDLPTPDPTDPRDAPSLAAAYRDARTVLIDLDRRVASVEAVPPLPGPAGAAGAPGAAGPPGPALVLGIVPTVGDLPSGASTGDAWIVAADGHAYYWTGTVWHDAGPVRGPQGEPGPEGPAGPKGDPGDDADVSAVQAQVDELRAEVGDPHAVAVHTDLVGWVGEVDRRVAALEHTGEPVTADLTLYVDRYSGSYTRVMADQVTADPVKVDVALATTPGVDGAVFPDLGSIAGGAAVWADFAGQLGRVQTGDGSNVYGSALKEWIRRQSVLTVHRSATTPPNLVVTLIEDPSPAGSSLTLDALADVTAPDTTPAGKLLGTTAQGAWGPVDGPVTVSEDPPSGTPADGALWFQVTP